MIDYTDFLKEEMLPALGCTEPIALAYTAAIGRKYLGSEPKSIVVACSGNLIKNARSVIVPNSGGLKGIEIAVCLGATGGNPDKRLEVLTDLTPEDLARAQELVKQGACKVEHAQGIPGLYIDLRMEDGDGKSSRVILKYSHTHIAMIEQNGRVIYEDPSTEDKAQTVDFSFDAIYDFAAKADLKPLKAILDMEIEANSEIAREGLNHDWGSRIGRSLYSDGNEKDKEIAHAAAGSDARMSGCELPVVINSGSGNQGMTLSIPIIERAKNIGASRQELYRALVFANLIGEYQKANIGRLSAYCGAASAGAAAAAGLAFLEGEAREVIAETLSNALVTTSGLLCDGAKPSCAAKIECSLQSAYRAYDQAKEGRSFQSGDGLVGRTIDRTIRSMGRVAHEGMRETDVVILDEMLHQ